MQRAKVAVTEQNGPYTVPGLKYCGLCKELVHPHSKFTECKMEFCADKDRIHKKCIAYRLKNGLREVSVICNTCRMVSTWRWRPWLDSLRSSPAMLVWALLYMLLPMALVKWAGWGEPTKWDFSQQKVIIPHIFSSLLIMAIFHGFLWMARTSSSVTRWLFEKCCCCFACCRRGPYEDFY